MVKETRSAHRFGRLEVWPSQRQVMIEGRAAPLGGRAFDVLMALIERRNRLVSKHELLEVVWPGLHVVENNLTVQVGSLRRLLGPSMIMTIPGRGYRFVAPDAADADPGALAPAATVEASPRPPARSAAREPLIGRRADSESLAALAKKHRLVTVTGAGGIGKSRLAQQHLDHIAHGEADGPAWIELASVGTSVQAISTIARALRLAGTAIETETALVDALAPLSVLLVLDGAEHVLDVVASLVHKILTQTAGVRIVVTSQAPLRVASEHVMRLGPLALPGPGLSALQAASVPAVELLVKRVQAAERRFTLDENNVEALCDICRRLDGLPLAIELAAARVPALGVEVVRAALVDRLALLGRGYRDAPARQRTLRAALEWSHSLLGPAEQTLLRRLSVFAGSFSLALAQQVASDADLDEWTLLDALGHLIDRSLVVLMPGEPTRYRLLDSPRAFALENLRRAGEADAIRIRHMRAMLALFEHHYEEFFAGRQLEDDTLELLAPDLDNGRDALSCALEHDTDCAVGMMRPYAFAHRAASFADRRALWSRTASLLPSCTDPARRARWLIGASLLYTRTEPARALAMATEAIELLRDASPPRDLLLALYAAASAEIRMGSPAEPAAMKALEAKISAASPPILRHFAAWLRGNFCHSRADPAGALAAYGAARQAAQEAGASLDVLKTAIAVADLCLLTGRIDEAVAEGEELVRQLEGPRPHWLRPYALMNLAAALLARQDLEAAAAVSRRMLRHAFTLSDHRAAFSNYLAQSAALQSQPAQAAMFIGYGDGLYQRAGAERQGNEANAARQAASLALAALGTEAFEHAVAAGREMNDAEAEAAAAALLGAPGTEGESFSGVPEQRVKTPLI